MRDAVDEQVGLFALRTGVVLGQAPPGQALRVVLARFEGGGAAREGAAHQPLAGFVEHLDIHAMAMPVAFEELLGGLRPLLLEALAPFGGDAANAGMLGEDPGVLVQGAAEQQ
ncbi:hypothetical protein D3C78_1458970 [compost metagenome]